MEDCIQDSNILFCIRTGHMWGVIFFWLLIEIWMRIKR